MKKGDLVVDKCIDPEFNNGIGVILYECNVFYERCPPWWYVFYFKLGKVIPESPHNIEVINET